MKFTRKNIIAITGIVIFVVLLILFYKKERVNKYAAPLIQEDTLPALPENLAIEYGMVLDSFAVAENTVKRGDNFSGILLRFETSARIVDRLATRSKDTFDVRKLIAGHTYKIFCSKDSSFTPRYFIYEKDYVNYVVFELFDSLRVYTGQKEIDMQIKSLSGTIRSSLYNAMKEGGATPALAIELADIYAWTVDFFGIQKGDHFQLIYEEKFLKDKSIGYGRILAACFTVNGAGQYAIYFEQEGQNGYFDETGKSLRRPLLKAPLQFSRISSRYSVRRFHPVLERFKPHLGTDYAAPIGTPVVSVGDGAVLEAAYKLNNGNYVKIKHNGTYTTGYLHLSKIASGIKAGEKVKQGDVIGYVGSTGLATGPHLCYRFWKNGQQVDALKEKIPPSEPMKEEYQAAYLQKKEEMIYLLSRIK